MLTQPKDQNNNICNDLADGAIVMAKMEVGYTKGLWGPKHEFRKTETDVWPET